MMNQSCSDQKGIIPFTLAGNQQEIMKVDLDGKVWANGQQIAVLHANGLLTDTRNDTIAIRKTDGTVYDANNKVIVKITDDGTMEYGEDKNLAWKSDGTLEIMQNELLTLEPNNKALYSIASLLFVIYASIGESPSVTPFEE